jgi:hypothetical protein
MPVNREKHVIHYGAELKVHGGRREQTADVLCANYSTTLSARSQAKCVSVAMTCDKGNLMGIPLARVQYMYVCVRRLIDKQQLFNAKQTTLPAAN